MKSITLRYRINGCLMKRTYRREDYKIAMARAEVLRENGIEVVVRNIPKRLEVCV